MKPIDLLLKYASANGWAKLILALALAIVVTVATGSYSARVYNQFKARRLEQSARRLRMASEFVNDESVLDVLGGLSGGTGGPGSSYDNSGQTGEQPGEQPGGKTGEPPEEEDLADIDAHPMEHQMERMMHLELDKMIDMKISHEELGCFVIVSRDAERAQPNVCSYLAVVAHTDVWQESRLSALI